MLSALAPVLDTFSRDGFAPLRAEWERYHVHQGREVSVTLPGGRTDVGMAQGVGDDGALLFETGNAVRRLHSGEIRPWEAEAPSRDEGASGARERSRP